MNRNLNSQEALEKLNIYKEMIDRELGLFFKSQLREVRGIDDVAVEAMRVLEDFSLRGGKRIRAALVAYGFWCFSQKKVHPDLVKFSLAMELAQSFLLIHDDIIDRDELRRGKDTVHKIFEKSGEKKFSFAGNIPEQEHFGRSMAVLVGDVCASLMNMLLSDTKSKNSAQAVYEINRMLRDTTFGQIIDLESGYISFSSKNLWQNTLKIYKLKTASYTIEIPLRIGAILAGASDEEIKKIRKYAEPLGVAFNIQDDLLGLFGKKEKFGKPIGSDLKEGKKTLVILKTLELVKKQDAMFIMNNLGNQEMTEDVVEKIKVLIVESGAFDFCVDYAKSLILQAKKNISAQGYQVTGESFLLGISDYLLERKY